MRVLITGGAGYIGSVLVGQLLAAGHAVTVLDNLMYRQTSLLSYVAEPQFTFVRGDARDETLLRRLVPEADAIIPLAAIVGASACDRDSLLATSVNLDAVRMLESLVTSEQRIVFPCTNSGYGTQSGEVYCTEETPLEPISLYGRTKVDAERLLLASGKAVSLRFATVFGPSPRMRLDLLVNDFVYRAVTQRSLVLYEEHFKRNYIHVRDAARAFVFALDHFEVMRGQAFNAGLNEANLSKRELAELIRTHVPSLSLHTAAIGEDPDKRNYVISNERLRAQGFEACIGLDQGVRELIAAYSMLPMADTVNA